MKSIVLALALFGHYVGATETTCTVKGMHCSGCREMVEGKLCDENKFSTCEVTIKDAKKQIGVLRLVAKGEGATVNEKEVGAVITDSGYTLDKCVTKDMKRAKKSI